MHGACLAAARPRGWERGFGRECRSRSLKPPASWAPDGRRTLTRLQLHPSGRFFLTVQESGEIQVWDATGVEPPRTLVAPPNTMVRFSADGSHLLGLVFPAERGEDGEILIWEVDGFDFHLLRRVENAKLDFSSFDPVGARLAMRGPLPAHRLWNLGAPAGSDPMILGVGPEGYVHEPSFSPDGQWLTTNGTNGTKMWPLARRYPSVIRVEFKPWSHGMAFPADGSFLATSAGVETRLWPLEEARVPAGEIVFQGSAGVDSVAVSSDGELFAVELDGVSLGRRGEPPGAWGRRLADFLQSARTTCSGGRQRLRPLTFGLPRLGGEHR